jgi:succinate dehydrogenase/fumarate reductase cytochrome b subunit
MKRGKNRSRWNYSSPNAYTCRFVQRITGLLQVSNVINQAKFHTDWLTGLDSAGVRKSNVSLGSVVVVNTVLSAAALIRYCVVGGLVYLAINVQTLINLKIVLRTTIMTPVIP